ncbi:MAG: hypothetical protein FWC32_13925 [Firmicutes bacterium]|nr:hypothetical protein [Bacillota bacterium]
MDITRNSEMVSQIHRRKSADYSERNIFPYAKEEHFDFSRLMPKVRRLLANRDDLIDAYEQLMDFIAKHTLDKFHLIGDQSVSLLSGISREIVSNILVHREYTSAYPAKIIVERDRIVTENWNLPKAPGRIDPNNFAPFPKNPLLAHFFINIGRLDVLGSGVRNLYKYTKLYSGGVPELIDGDVFKTIVPLTKSNYVLSDNAPRQMVLAYIEAHGEINATLVA